MVERGLYRSGQPTVLNFPFLETLKLKTIVYLAPDDPSQPLYVIFSGGNLILFSLNFVDDQGISFLHLGMEGIYKNPWNPISEDGRVTAS